ncbi:Toprim domain-containing protein [Methylobacterium sp. 190mf]|uniref:DUF7146 domain-containing protein n=1 Tax=Methylobacterium sp. 190mf TaxID=1761798 RepID=UPI00089F47CC|nr:toprim domain-containing protein [Methylobacterium sp. 190mf]SEG69719.1 Toprim domain-containing protein [Methylobacterium sp. 190mf]
MSLRFIADRLEGVVVGDHVRAPGPGRSADSRSLMVRLAPHLRSGILVYDYASDDQRAAFLYAANKLGLSPPETRADRRSWMPSQQDLAAAQVKRRKAEVDEAGRSRRALSIWYDSRSPHGTPVERYLVEQRGLTLPPEAAGASLRFHASCPFNGQRVPAMVALVRDIATGRPLGVHRTALDRDGRKVKVGGVDRLSCGPIRGGAIQLTPADAVGDTLAIGEGIESALSIRHLPGVPVRSIWSLIAAGGVRAFPVLPGLTGLWLAVDHDEAGLRASSACAARYRQAGVGAHLVVPHEPGTDLNDLIKGDKDA